MIEKGEKMVSMTKIKQKSTWEQRGCEKESGLSGKRKARTWEGRKKTGRNGFWRRKKAFNSLGKLGIVMIMDLIRPTYVHHVSHSSWQRSGDG